MIRTSNEYRNKENWSKQNDEKMKKKEEKNEAKLN